VGGREVLLHGVDLAGVVAGGGELGDERFDLEIQLGALGALFLRERGDFGHRVALFVEGGIGVGQFEAGRGELGGEGFDLLAELGVFGGLAFGVGGDFGEAAALAALGLIGLGEAGAE